MVAATVRADIQTLRRPAPTGNSTYAGTALSLNGSRPTPAGPPRLVLITCDGPFDPVGHHYDDNVIVTAEPRPLS